MNDQDKQPWFLRIPIDVVRNRFILENASAVDWSVLLAIAQHQGYKNRRTFPISIDRTAEEAGCCRRAAIKSITWWVNLRVLLKTKQRRLNVYEIAQHFSIAPGKGALHGHKTPRTQKRNHMGRYVHSTDTHKVHRTDTFKVHGTDTPNQKSLSEVFNENPPPPPTGGNGHASEASARPLPPAPLSISEATIKELVKVKGKAGILELLKKGNYPIPEFLLAEESDGQNRA